MFGEGGGTDEKAANGKANGKASAMEVDEDEENDKENTVASPAKVAIFRIRNSTL